jgi:putative DNA primase/helicase
MAVLFKSVKSIYPCRIASDWDGLRELLAFHEENAVKQAGALWSPVEYYPGTTRGNRNVRFVEALVVDMDGAGFDECRLDGLEWFAYSTYSHRFDDPHYHLVLPLAERVPASLWRAVWQELVDRLRLPADPATKDPARLFYLPQHAPDQPFEFHEGSGRLLDADWDWDVLSQPYELPVAGSRRSASNKRRVVHDSDGLVFAVTSDDWWERGDASRFGGLTGPALYQEALRQFRELRYGVSVTE